MVISTTFLHILTLIERILLEFSSIRTLLNREREIQLMKVQMIVISENQCRPLKLYCAPKFFPCETSFMLNIEIHKFNLNFYKFEKKSQLNNRFNLKCKLPPHSPLSFCFKLEDSSQMISLDSPPTHSETSWKPETFLLAKEHLDFQIPILFPLHQQILLKLDTSFNEEWCGNL